MQKIKRDSKDIYITKDQMNAVFLLFIKESWKDHGFQKKILTVFNIDIDRKYSWVVNQHISMISEGSCDHVFSWHDFYVPHRDSHFNRILQ